MAGPLRNYLAAVGQALSSEDDGSSLESLLRLEKSHCPGGAAIVTAVQAVTDDLESAIRSTKVVPAGWEDVLAPHLRACLAWAQAGSANVTGAGAGSSTSALKPTGKLLEAFSHQNDALIALNPRLGDHDARIVRPLLRMVSDAGALSRGSEQEAVTTGRKDAYDELIKRFVSTVRDAFGGCFNHRVPKEMASRSRKLAALELVNVSFRLCFKLHAPRQCKFFVTAVERDGWMQDAIAAAATAAAGAGTVPKRAGGSSSSSGPAFPLSQVVTYRYYTGVLSMYEDSYQKANDSLSFALSMCPAAYTGNRRRILQALIPVRLHLGILPSRQLLRKYGLEAEYGGIVDGLRCGNLRAYRTCLEEHQDSFIAAGTYLLLEKLQGLVVRTLVKRVSRHTGKNQIPLPLLAALLNGPAIGHPASFPVDVDEIECTLANLVHKKLIRGYINHRPPVLVIAKTGAFPRVAQGGGAGAGAGGDAPMG